ncbi:MAG: hypothetical protein MK076_03115 [Flavobacteriales bacterium]|nr:hypothetical protein [Flavobacteriales bacterium]
MPKYKCVKTFAGKFMGRKGNDFICNDQEVIEDLLKAGYIVEVKAAPKKRRKPPVKKKTEE